MLVCRLPLGFEGLSESGAYIIYKQLMPRLCVVWAPEGAEQELE